MKRIILITLLAIVSLSASAQWQRKDNNTIYTTLNAFYNFINGDYQCLLEFKYRENTLIFTITDQKGKIIDHSKLDLLVFSEHNKDDQSMRFDAVVQNNGKSLLLKDNEKLYGCSIFDLILSLPDKRYKLTILDMDSDQSYLFNVPVSKNLLEIIR